MMAPSYKSLATAVLPVLLVAIFGCTELPDEPVYDNPLDPDNPDSEYVPPETDIRTGPTEGAEVNDHTVTFTWGGNELVEEYRYRLTGDWSAWSGDSSHTFIYLDEGDYLFEVQGRYATAAEDTTPATRNFEIDDIQGPALWFSPRLVEAPAGNEFTVDLLIEDVPDIVALLAQVEFDPGQLELVGYQLHDQAGDFLTQHNGNVIALVDSAFTQGSVSFNLAVTGGDQLGVKGSGTLLTLTFQRTTSSGTQVDLGSSSRMVSIDLANIIFTELAPAVVAAP
ncbi:MAG: cohesin domain-containing protein [Candidatus Neomarinimicrobiota bacterium]